MSLIFLVENEEQLHWMFLSTFFLKLKMSLIYVALCLKQQRTLFQREGLWVCKIPGWEEVPAVATQDGLVGTEVQYYL